MPSAAHSATVAAARSSLGSCSTARSSAMPVVIAPDACAAAGSASTRAQSRGARRASVRMCERRTLPAPPELRCGCYLAAL